MRWLLFVTIFVLILISVAVFFATPGEPGPAQRIATIFLSVLAGAAALAEVLGLLDRFTKAEIKLGFDVAYARANLKGSAFQFSRDQSSLASEFVVHLNAKLAVSCSGPATSVKCFIASVSPACLQEGVSASDIEVKLHRGEGRSASSPENPFYLNPDEMIDPIWLDADIPLETARIEKALGSLASLQEMTVKLGAQATGRKPVFQIVECDLTGIHEHIEQDIASRIQHGTEQIFPGLHIVQVLKRYWLGPAEAD